MPDTLGLFMGRAALAEALDADCRTSADVLLCEESLEDP